jgi:hypothetical protein
MALLEHLAGLAKKADLTSKQREFLESISLDDLKGMEEEQIAAILDLNGIEVPFMSKVLDRTNKKMFQFNMHSNSDEFKNLGNLHRERRVVEFFPQDDKMNFSTKPQIQTNEAKAEIDKQSQISLKKHLVGEELRRNRLETDLTNF